MFGTFRVGTDLDGVNDNFGEGVRQTLEALGLGHVWKSGPSHIPVYWNFFEEWGWDWPQFKELCDQGVDMGIIFGGHFRPGAVAAMQRIKNTGSDIIVLTDRAFGTVPENSHKNTREALNKFRFPYDEIHFTSDKTSVQIDMMNEDKMENYLALVEAGTPTWLIDQQWNQDLGDVPTRIADVTVYADIVEKIVTENVTPARFYAEQVGQWAVGRPAKETEVFWRSVDALADGPVLV